MTTPRQTLRNLVVDRMVDLNFEAWRFQHGDPDTESKTYKFCKEHGHVYSPKTYKFKDIDRFMDGIAGDRKNRRPEVYAYYMEASEKQLQRLEREIWRAVQRRMNEKITLYDMQKLASRPAWKYKLGDSVIVDGVPGIVRDIYGTSLWIQFTEHIWCNVSPEDIDK